MIPSLLVFKIHIFSVRSSLIFVFDITGSMKPELEDVKRGASKILQEVNQNLQENENKIIDDYILVPFDDPGIEWFASNIKTYFPV